MQCTWDIKIQQCECEATEKWTEILKPDPYGGWEAVAHEVPDVLYYCDKHIAETIMTFAKLSGGAIKGEKLLKEMFVIERLND